MPDRPEDKAAVAVSKAGVVAVPPDTVVRRDGPRATSPGFFRRFFALREEIPVWQAVFWGALAIVCVLLLWWFLTQGETNEDRILSPTILPSPAETFDSEQLRELWVDRSLTRNLWASLRRVILGFGLAALVGVPLGVICGCFSWAKAFFAPLTIFGRNIPVAALIPLTFAFFGTGEEQKIMFIFIATVAFVIIDTTSAILDVSERYIDTAYTLGASRRQIVLKVLVPLAMPRVFNSLRLLFGLAFGYIMLAELVKASGDYGGLGDIINTSQRRNSRETILLILMIIPLVALFIDRILYWTQRSLFPHLYGGAGILNGVLRFTNARLEDIRGFIIPPKSLDAVHASIPSGGSKQ
jgi:NitT/TauT family transport system permease protein